MEEYEMRPSKTEGVLPDMKISFATMMGKIGTNHEDITEQMSITSGRLDNGFKSLNSKIDANHKEIIEQMNASSDHIVGGIKSLKGKVKKLPTLGGMLTGTAIIVAVISGACTLYATRLETPRHLRTAQTAMDSYYLIPPPSKIGVLPPTGRK